MLAECRNRSADKSARFDVADKGDEVAFGWIQQPEWPGILLAARTVVLVADRLQTQHGRDPLAPLAATTRVDT